MVRWQGGGGTITRWQGGEGDISGERKREGGGIGLSLDAPILIIKTG